MNNNKFLKSNNSQIIIKINKSLAKLHIKLDTLNLLTIKDNLLTKPITVESAKMIKSFKLSIEPLNLNLNYLLTILNFRKLFNKELPNKEILNL